MIKNLRLLIKELIKEALGTKTIYPTPTDDVINQLKIPSNVTALQHYKHGGDLSSISKRANDANKKFLSAWDQFHKDEEEQENKRKRSEELYAQLRAQSNDDEPKKNVDQNAPTVAPVIKNK